MRREQAVVSGGLDFAWVLGHNVGLVTLLCGHCGAYTRTEVEVIYSDPGEMGLTFKEQQELWVDSFTYTHPCPRCGVLNVDGEDLETFLRKDRESWDHLDEVWRRMVEANQGPDITKD